MSDNRKYTFGKEKRLVHQRDFERVFERGKKIRKNGFTFVLLKNELSHPRLGISVGKKYGNAVRRNRIKRKIREAFRLTQYELDNYDITCIPYPSAKNARVSEIKKLFRQVCSDENFE